MAITQSGLNSSARFAALAPLAIGDRKKNPLDMSVETIFSSGQASLTMSMSRKLPANSRSSRFSRYTQPMPAEALAPITATRMGTRMGIRTGGET